MKYRVKVETKIVYEAVLEFHDETEESVRDYLVNGGMGEFPELFAEKSITDNYTDVDEVELMVEG